MRELLRDQVAKISHKQNVCTQACTHTQLPVSVARSRTHTWLNGCIFSPLYLSHTLKANSPSANQKKKPSFVVPAILFMGKLFNSEWCLLG